MMCRMLICIGGFPGSGSHFLAEALSKTLGFHYFSLDHLKEHPLFMQEYMFTRTRRGSDFSDETLLRMYQEAASRFNLDSKMYPDMIIRDHFAREIPREYLFNEAEKNFGTPLIIWADSSKEEEILFLKEALQAKQEVLKRKLSIVGDIREHFQPFTRPVHSIHYVNNPAALDEALALVRANSVS